MNIYIYISLNLKISHGTRHFTYKSLKTKIILRVLGKSSTSKLLLEKHKKSFLNFSLANATIARFVKQELVKVPYFNAFFEDKMW